jgi:hypothetical protein
MRTTKADRHWLAEHALDIHAFNEWLLVLSSPRILQAMNGSLPVNTC